jgi:hypothetical protein
MLLAVSLMCFARTGLDGMNYKKNSQVRQRIGGILNTVEDAKLKLENEKRKGSEYEAIILKEFEPFNYREMIPYLHEVIISALPNEKNNPKQARLYKAFAEGDVEGILEIPREAREQIFITNMSAFFTSDLAAAQFGGADLWRRSRGTPGAEGEGYEMMEEYEYEMMMEMERMGGQYGQYYPGGGMFGMGGEAAEEKMPGFVVTVAGYSPYGKNKNDLHKLIDPPGVENKPDEWGFVTRLLHLDDFVAEGNSTFEVYKKTDPNQFKLEIEGVSWEVEMPAGIGIRDVRYKPTPPGSTQEESAEWVLIDPMTKELISKIAEWDENGRPKLDRRGMPIHTVNDHWFVLNVKFVWVDAPEAVKAVAPTFPGMPGMMGRPGMVSPPAPQSPP